MRKPLLRVLLAACAGALVLAGTAGAANYIVLYKGTSVPADAATTVASAGGTLVASYGQIGVAVARSDSASFRANLLKDSRIEGAASTAGFGIRADDGSVSFDATDALLSGVNAPVADTDTLSGLQWDMRQIHTPEAHAITGGSPSVVVGDLDTGLDFTHPDLAPNYDPSDSANCESGVPTPLLPGNDQAGHGTHTAGTIAAAANGIGIVGVAPRVRIAGIKAGNDDGFFFPEAVVCAFVWAGSHHIDVTNNSYFADPWLFNCKNDPEQRAIWKAETRAAGYAMSQGTVVVAAEGNFSDDLAHPTQDVLSPDTGPGTTRAIHNDCAVFPVEMAGVIGVTADGNLRIKSFYSNYGVGTTEVTAPGGDSILQRTAAAPNGRVLSTWPSYLLPFCRRPVVDPSGATYCYLQGTSMAAPHVTGVAALVMSQFGKLSPGEVAAIIQQTADPIGCPDAATLALYAPFPSFSNGAPQACQGGSGSNSWYGKGEVNALSAITHSP